MISFIQINTTQHFFSWSIILCFYGKGHDNRLLGFKIECYMLLIDYLIQGTFIVARYCKLFWDNSEGQTKTRGRESVFFPWQSSPIQYLSCQLVRLKTGLESFDEMRALLIQESTSPPNLTPSQFNLFPYLWKRHFAKYKDDEVERWLTSSR